MPKYLIFYLVLSNLRECLGVALRGARAQDGQFPWLIQFHTVAPCGGVLVSPDWVLTAAQCLEEKRNSIVLYATGLNGTGTSQTVSVKATYIYPEFQAYSNPRDFDHNIALLKLVRAFDMCDGKVRLLDIAPVRLDHEYKSCLIFGWQSTVAPRTLKVHAKPVQYSQVLLNSWWVCMYMHERNASYRNIRNVFCTMIDDEDGIRACAGNPGSPVVCEDKYHRMVLLGIASWSNFSLDCGGLPTYLGVSNFRNWMLDLISDNNRNKEDWKVGMESGVESCQQERHLGGIYAENNLQSRIDNNYTDRRIHFGKSSDNAPEDGEDEIDDYAMSWRHSSGKNYAAKNSGKETKDIAKIPELRGKLEPPAVFDDYSRVIVEKSGPRIAQNFDVLREREEQLSQYREIGRGDHDRRQDRVDDSVGVPSQQDRIVYRPGKTAKKFLERETHEQELAESFDDLELVMPDGIEDFSRSEAATIFFDFFLHFIIFTNTCIYVNGNIMIL